MLKYLKKKVARLSCNTKLWLDTLYYIFQYCQLISCAAVDKNKMLEMNYGLFFLVYNFDLNLGIF